VGCRKSDASVNNDDTAEAEPQGNPEGPMR